MRGPAPGRPGATRLRSLRSLRAALRAACDALTPGADILRTRMSLLPFCEWLASTAGSIALHESLYVYPLVESVHVWALALFLGMVTLVDLRLLGVALREVPVSQL